MKNHSAIAPNSGAELPYAVMKGAPSNAHPEMFCSDKYGLLQCSDGSSVPHSAVKTSRAATERSRSDVHRAKISRGCRFYSLDLMMLNVGKLFGVREDGWNRNWQVLVI